jgi:SAM-dependent methyltransferase
MSFDAVRDLLARLSPSANALAAVGSALEARLSGRTLPPDVQTHLDGVLAALGAPDAFEGVSGPEIKPLLAEARMSLYTGARLLSQPGIGPGWNYTDAEILQSAGDVSLQFPHVMKRLIVPRLEGLADRLERPGARFLDIGVGVAALATEMARVWPALRVVGVDPWQPSLALARQNVQNAALEGRIELREQRAEAISDKDAFDLVWVAAPFIPGKTLAAVVERGARALQPGGWMLLGIINPNGDPLTTALGRWRVALWNGAVMGTTEAEALLRQAGLVDVRLLPGPPSAPAAMIAGRRAVAGW